MADLLVFITGSTGFIGSHVVDVTLKAGYRVRLSIRNPEQAEPIRQRYPEYASKIETVVIPDISKQESFKKALENVTYIFHLASPMPGNGSDIRTDYVNPAVQGTEAILYAALEFPKIRKVVITSSVLALLPVDVLTAGKEVSIKGEVATSLYNGSRLTRYLTDNIGKTIPVDLDMSFPEDLTGHGMKYAASKILAHEATRDFLDKNNPQYILITLHPTFVLGHSLIQESAKDIGGINGLFWLSLFSEKPLIPTAWVHVRDVADVHLKALTAPVESGKEFLLSAPTFSWEEGISFIKTHYPALSCKFEAPVEEQWKLDVTNAENTFGIQWKNMETMIQDVIEQQLTFQKE